MRGLLAIVLAKAAEHLGCIEDNLPHGLVRTIEQYGDGCYDIGRENPGAAWRAHIWDLGFDAGYEHAHDEPTVTTDVPPALVRSSLPPLLPAPRKKR